jgi:hypothetical protein
MESSIVNSVVEVDKEILVGDTIFALFDNVWFKGVVEELRPKNIRDKHFCVFEDGDSRSMNIKGLFKAIPVDSKWPSFSQPEANSTTEASNLSIISDTVSDSLVGVGNATNLQTEATGTVSINNEFSDSTRASHDYGSSFSAINTPPLCESFQLIHSDGPSSYCCISQSGWPQ